MAMMVASDPLVVCHTGSEGWYGYAIGEAPVMSKKHRVRLAGVERECLLDRIRRGRGSARDLAHGRILLKADEGADGPSWKDEQIVATLDVSLATVERVRRRFATEGLTAPRGSQRRWSVDRCGRTSRGSSTAPRKRS